MVYTNPGFASFVYQTKEDFSQASNTLSKYLKDARKEHPLEIRKIVPLNCVQRKEVYYISLEERGELNYYYFSIRNEKVVIQPLPEIETPSMTNEFNSLKIKHDILEERCQYLEGENDKQRKLIEEEKLITKAKQMELEEIKRINESTRKMMQNVVYTAQRFLRFLNWESKSFYHPSNNSSLEKFSQQDCQILHINTTASQEDLKEAWKKFAFTFHTDKIELDNAELKNGFAEHFKRGKNVYETFLRIREDELKSMPKISSKTKPKPNPDEVIIVDD